MPSSNKIAEQIADQVRNKINLRLPASIKDTKIETETLECDLCHNYVTEGKILTIDGRASRILSFQIIQSFMCNPCYQHQVEAGFISERQG